MDIAPLAFVVLIESGTQVLPLSPRSSWCSRGIYFQYTMLLFLKTIVMSVAVEESRIPLSHVTHASIVSTEGGIDMARGRKTALTIRLTSTERQTLLGWQRATTIAAGRARRARIILLVADGLTVTDVAATVGLGRRFVYKWVQRFLEQGAAGLADKPGRGSRRVSRPAPVADAPRKSA